MGSRHESAAIRVWLAVVVAIGISAWSANKVLSMTSHNDGSSQGRVYALQDLPSLGGDAPPSQFDAVMAQIRQFGREHDAFYAGAFLSGQEIFVGFTDDVLAQTERLQRTIGPFPRLRAFQADFAYKTLVAAMEDIARNMNDWRRRGITISAIALDEYRNRIAITVTKTSSTALASLQKMYGDIFIFSEGQFTAV